MYTIHYTVYTIQCTLYSNINSKTKTNFARGVRVSVRLTGGGGGGETFSEINKKKQWNSITLPAAIKQFKGTESREMYLMFVHCLIELMFCALSDRINVLCIV